MWSHAAGSHVIVALSELLLNYLCHCNLSSMPRDTKLMKVVPEAGLTCRTLLQGTIVAIENKQRRLYGLQYHPEVQHSERGIATLRRFLFGIAKMPADWKIENVLKEEMEKIRGLVRARPVLRSVLRTSTAHVTVRAVLPA